jgi:predicted restriction endonuclease
VNKLVLDNKEYEVIDAKESITIPDCFVKDSNKIGHGHGEAKLYVGQTTDGSTLDFFENFNGKCVIKKEDLVKYLLDCEKEYKHPDQEYRNKENMPNIFSKHWNFISDINDEYLYFDIYRVDVNPPRIYINSHSKAYEIIREICLPNISYIAILKLRSDNEQLFYFRPFIEYNLESLHETEIETIEEDTNITTSERETIIKSRVGQGKYREKLLIECPYCPITMVNDERLLIASHIKPWVVSNNFEKTDPKNGFMLTPTYDKLFDRGFISFENDGTMLVSPWISPMNQKRLEIFNGKKIRSLPTEGREEYLFYHREFVFKK